MCGFNIQEKVYAQYDLCYYGVYSRKIINKLFKLVKCGLVENF